MSQEKNNTLLGVGMGMALIAPVIIWVIYSMASITQEARAIYLYNPHEQLMQVEIDGEQYTLDASEKQKIKISAGVHQVKSTLAQTVLVDSTIQVSGEVKKNGGLINLSGQSLYLWKERYGGNSLVEQQISRDIQVIQIDSTLIFGMVEEYPPNELVLEKEWYFGIDEDFAEEITANNNSTASIVGETKAKLFDKKGALIYWEENYGDLFEGEE